MGSRRKKKLKEKKKKFKFTFMFFIIGLLSLFSMLLVGYLNYK